MDIKRIVMAGGVLATAGAIGFVMQNGESAKARYAAAAPVPEISGTAENPLEVTDIKLTSANAADRAPQRSDSAVLSDAEIDAALSTAPPKQDGSSTPAVQMAALDEPAQTGASDALPEPQSLCQIDMSAEPVAAAMVDVTIKANCYPNERVTLHHNGMMFTEATDAQGELKVTVPALSENAVFIAAFANGEGGLANAKVPSLEFYDRFVVQSKASSALHINAFEYGADFREDGHVSAASARSMADAAKGIGGFVTALGETERPEGLVAEVYTFPTATATREGEVHISVDAEVTTANCGLRIDAQTLEVKGAGQMKVQDLTLPIPACDAVGDFLVLQNLLSDLKVARN